MEKWIMPKIKDFDLLANGLKEIQKVIDSKREADIIIIR